MKESGEIIIYSTADGSSKIEVNLKDDNIWLNQNQLSELFKRDRSVITRHINNIFKENELPKKGNVQKMHFSHSDKPINYYNLDVIISLGYRIKSKTGTQFRIWANNVLKNHLIKGYSLNEKRLKQLKKTVQLITRTAKNSIPIDDLSKNLINVLDDYTKALNILDDYDHQRIKKIPSLSRAVFKIDYNEALKAIQQLRVNFGASRLFGNEKDNSFKSSIAVIDQTFGGNDLYPSIEEKAANLLYLVVKNHSFTDGNKRIAAWLFVWYLDKNNFLYHKDGKKKITNDTLVALTIMIAESNPKEKELIINIIINLIHIENE
ncbi:RhuM family protein [Aestuariivivens insulae]|uniref:RhuM family protein n=1 Tax=Aestuariivivens insulae TaxID=1621988 RepID=UPI001F57E746|nr:RhuM family protein [Aestuariivivens insulae]